MTISLREEISKIIINSLWEGDSEYKKESYKVTDKIILKIEKRIGGLNPNENSPNIENWGVQYFMGYKQAISIIKEILK